MGYKFIDIFFERHIGIGIRWETNTYCDFALSIGFPFFSVVISFDWGKND